VAEITNDGWLFIAILPLSKTQMARRQKQDFFREDIHLAVFLSIDVCERELTKQVGGY